MSAWYNEFDPKKAAWLRELIAAGLIAPGFVDERSIADVRADELAAYDQCHFFAGVGIWSYALRLAGWPDTRQVWTGSCPCQPFSAAGKGAAFDDERHLWPVWFPLIEARRPVVCFGEQVASIDGLGWLDLVHSDLDGAGYTCGAVDLCAAGVGAPHRRQRLYWVADAQADRRQHGPPIAGSDAAGVGSPGGRNVSCVERELIGMADDSRGGCGIERDASQPGSCGHDDGGGVAIGLGNARGARLEKRRREPGDVGQERAALERAGHAGGMENAMRSERRQRSASGRQDEGSDRTGERSPAWSMADSDGRHAGAKGLQRSGEHRQRAQDGGDVPVARGPVNGYWSGSDWVLTRPQRVGDRPGLRPVERGSFPLAHGSAARVGRLRGYGDGIVAQAAKGFIEAYIDATRT